MADSCVTCIQPHFRCHTCESLSRWKGRSKDWPNKTNPSYTKLQKRNLIYEASKLKLKKKKGF
jgi:hypothetical protein